MIKVKRVKSRAVRQFQSVMTVLIKLQLAKYYFHKRSILKQNSSHREPTLLLLVFSVTPFKVDQNKNQNYSIDKVQNLGNERR